MMTQPDPLSAPIPVPRIHPGKLWTSLLLPPLTTLAVATSLGRLGNAPHPSSIWSFGSLALALLLLVLAVFLLSLALFTNLVTRRYLATNNVLMILAYGFGQVTLCLGLSVGSLLFEILKDMP